MSGVCRTISCLFLLYFTQSINGATLPASFKPVNPALAQTSNASFTTPGTLTFRKIRLHVDEIGQKIPKREVIDTLKAANDAISDVVHALPNQRITNDRFEYRRVNGNMLILISPNPGEELTWMELARVLHALFRFMTGTMGATEEHFNTLDFLVETGFKHIIGNGLVWYFPPDDKVRERASPFRNPTMVSPNATVLHTSMPIHVPGTTVMLVITNLGDPVPPFEVGAGLTNALRTIQASLKDHGETPIEDHQFWYRDSMSHLWLYLTASNSKVITWRELSWTMVGLLHWMKGDHCRELNFEIDIDGEGYVGFGSLGYDPTGMVRPLELANGTLSGNITAV